MINKTDIYQQKIIFDGNSIFNKDGANAIEQKYISSRIRDQLPLDGYFKLPVFDFSVSGKTTQQLISDFPTKVAPSIRTGDIVVFTEMTNDVGVNAVTALQAKNNILAYRDLVLALGGKFVLQGAIACNGLIAGYANITATLQACNDYFRNTPSLVNAFSDPGALTQANDDADCTNATYYLAADQIHPTTTLQDLIWPLTLAAIKTVL